MPAKKAATKFALDANLDVDVIATSEPVRDERVIEMYQEGSTVQEIIKDTGVPKSTIYFILNKHNVPTNRIVQGGRNNYVPASDLLAQLREADYEIGALRAKVEKLEALVAYLSTFTAAVRPPGAIKAPARPRPTKREVS